MVKVKKVDSYSEQVEKILKEVERIFRDEASMSHGVKIVIEMGMDMVPQISYEIREKVVI